MTIKTKTMTKEEVIQKALANELPRSGCDHPSLNSWWALSIENPALKTGDLIKAPAGYWVAVVANGEGNYPDGIVIPSHISANWKEDKMTKELKSITCTECHCNGIACYCNNTLHEHVRNEQNENVFHYVSTCEDPAECWKPMHFST